MEAGIVVGRKIQQARIDMGLNEDEFEGLIPYGRSTIRRWALHGYTGSMDELAAIHELLGIPLWELLPTEEELEGK